MRAGPAAGDLCFGQACVWRTWRALFGRGLSDCARTVHLHAIRNSRCRGGPVAGDKRVLLFALIGPGETVAVGMLGLCGNLRAELVDQKLDRTGLPAGVDIFVSAADTQSASHFE